MADALLQNSRRASSAQDSLHRQTFVNDNGLLPGSPFRHTLVILANEEIAEKCARLPPDVPGTDKLKILGVVLRERLSGIPDRKLPPKGRAGGCFKNPAWRQGVPSAEVGTSTAGQIGYPGCLNTTETVRALRSPYPG